jgi:hypothetical protein
MSGSIVINIYPGAQEPRLAIAKDLTMDDVKIILDVGSDRWMINVSRVPNIGEKIFFQDRSYIVQSVTHTPNSGYSAEVIASLSRP